MYWPEPRIILLATYLLRTAVRGRLKRALRTAGTRRKPMSTAERHAKLKTLRLLLKLVEAARLATA